jgi:CRISPR/Cas system-associated exonuclease Cas4 (RecB family)
VTVPFDDQLRAWILRTIRDVQESKLRSTFPRRSHNHSGKCRSCGFRTGCLEAL